MNSAWTLQTLAHTSGEARFLICMIPLILLMITYSHLSKRRRAHNKIAFSGILYELKHDEELKAMPDEVLETVAQLIVELPETARADQRERY